MIQLDIFNQPVLPTSAPINVERLTGQNRALYDYLRTGATINCMSDARARLGIGYLNSRVSDLRKAGVSVYKRMIEVGGVHVKEYSMFPFPQP